MVYAAVAFFLIQGGLSTGAYDDVSFLRWEGAWMFLIISMMFSLAVLVLLWFLLCRKKGGRQT
jgi:hypothetical protein